MKALSVRQPWSGLIVAGIKPIENRTWSTRYRGRLLICSAAAHDDSPEAQHAARLLPADVSAAGVALGVVTLVDVVRDHPSPWATPGCWHWVLADPLPLVDPRPVRGQLGLFEVAGVAGIDDETRSADWRRRAACRDAGPELFYPVGSIGPAAEQIEQAKAICQGCPVRRACLEFAVTADEQYGVWAACRSGNAASSVEGGSSRDQYPRWLDAK